MIVLDVSENAPVELSLADASGAEWGADEYVKVRYSELPDYAGPTEWTPAPYAQIIPTDGCALRSDIIVNPIPSNYGLVTWNGSVLTVS